MRALETTYRGWRFRSRLEARYAVFFDVLGVQWEYEKEGYDLSGHFHEGQQLPPGSYYLPDFWLKNVSFRDRADDGVWFEVKGRSPEDDEVALLNILGDVTGFPAVIVAGLWEPTPEFIEMYEAAPFWDEPMHFYKCHGRACGHLKIDWGLGNRDECPRCGGLSTPEHEGLLTALRHARGTRFDEPHLRRVV